jgi:hypothetical protein
MLFEELFGGSRDDLGKVPLNIEKQTFVEVLEEKSSKQ